MAAMLAIAARDRGRIRICFQVSHSCVDTIRFQIVSLYVCFTFQLLIYPMLDDRTGSSRPAEAGTGHIIWNAERNRYGWSALMGVPAGSIEVRSFRDFFDLAAQICVDLGLLQVARNGRYPLGPYRRVSPLWTGCHQHGSA